MAATSVTVVRQRAPWNPWRALLRFRRRFVLAAEPVMLLYFFSYIISSALLQQYMYNRYAQELFRSELNYTGSFNFCINSDVVDMAFGDNVTHLIITQASSYLSLVNGLAVQLPGIAAALVFGPISDRIGRRPLMVVISVAGIASGVLTLLLMYFQWRVEILPAFTAILGLAGGTPGMLTVLFAFTADVTSKRLLTLRLGLLEAMIFVGGSLAVLINGQWLSHTGCDFTGPVYMYIAAYTGIILYTCLWLPESLSREERLDRTRDKPFCSLVTQGFKLFYKKGAAEARWKLWLGFFIVFIAYFVATGVVDIVTLFLLNPPLRWEPGLIGLYQAMTQAMLGLALFTLLPLLVLLKVPDPFLMLLGFTWAAGASVATGFVRETWQMFTVGVLAGVEIVGFPAVRSSMSKAIRPEDQGALFSIVAVGQVLSGVLATVLFFFLLPWFTVQLHLPAGNVFFVAAAVVSLTWPLALVFIASWAWEKWRRQGYEKVQPLEGSAGEESVTPQQSSNALYFGSNSGTRVNS